MKNNVWQVLNFAWELGYLIAIPIAILGFGGAALDKRLGTTPTFIITGIVLSIVISGAAVYRKIKNLA